MIVVCMDLEGVILPEIWEKVAEETGIEELEVTTRTVSDFPKLMEYRFKHLKENGVRIDDILETVTEIEPLPGATDFLKWLDRKGVMRIAVSGSFYEFLRPLMPKLNLSLIFANDLDIDADGYLQNFHYRNSNSKMDAVNMLKEMDLKTVAIGDSLNDIEILRRADQGILFRPSEKLREELPGLPEVQIHAELQEELKTSQSKYFKS